MPEQTTDQSKQYLTIAASAAEQCNILAVKITDLEASIAEAEEKHGIKDMKKRVRDMRKEMEEVAFKALGKSIDAVQGKLFEDPE